MSGQPRGFSYGYFYRREIDPSGGQLWATQNGFDIYNFRGGNVGINQTTPQYTLDVNGSLRATTIIDKDLSSGLSGQVLKSTATGIKWSSDAGTDISGGSVFGNYLYWDTTDTPPRWDIGGTSNIKIGSNSGSNNQGTGSIAIGFAAGRTGQGSNSIAIGALAGQTNQHTRSIILNAGGTDISSFNTDALYINPIRNSTGSSNQFNSLYYNATSKEVSYLPNEYINVKTYGAVGDGVTDDTAAIQNAINANAGKSIFFPQGTYDISGTLTITSADTLLVGTGYSTSIIRQRTNTTILYFTPPNITVSNISGNGIMNLELTYSNPALLTNPNIPAIWLQRQNKFLINNVWVSSSQQALKITGSFSTDITCFHTNDSTSQPFLSGSSIILIENDYFASGSGGYTTLPAGVINFTDCQLRGARLGSGSSPPYHTKEYAIYGKQMDGISFVNCYFGNVDNHFIAYPDTFTDPSGVVYYDYIQNVSFTACYLDSTGLNANWITQRSLIVKNQNRFSVVYNIKYSNCFINVDRNIVYVDFDNSGGLAPITSPIIQISNCVLDFFNSPLTKRYTDFSFIKTVSPFTGGTIMLNNNNFNGENARTLTGGQAIDVSGIYSLIATGNTFRITTDASSNNCSLFYYTGSNNTVNLTGNHHITFTNQPDISFNTGATITNASIIGNTSLSTSSNNMWDYIRLPTNNIAIGNTAGCNNVGSGAIAIGSSAGFIGQGSNAIAIGFQAGQSNKASSSIAIGFQAGLSCEALEAIAIGNQAGQLNQGTYSVAIGSFTGNVNQSSGAVALGISAGRTTQGTNAIAIGVSAGRSNQQQQAIAIGESAGSTNQGTSAIAIGQGAGQSNQATFAIAIGGNSGTISQGRSAIAIGNASGDNNQSSGAIALGSSAGRTAQGTNAIAIGVTAGQQTQGSNALSIGVNAGQINQGSAGIAMGNNAGSNNQGTNAIAIGNNAGLNQQNQGATSIGCNAGNSNQGTQSIAIGNSAGQINQGSAGIAIGVAAGQTNQGTNAIAIGNVAGQSNQSSNAIAIGISAGLSNQSLNAIAIGSSAGISGEGINTVAIGANAGRESMGQNSVAIGSAAGQSFQGTNAVAIGANAGLGTQGSNSVAIGNGAGQVGQGINSVAVGFTAGSNAQASQGTAFGYGAGRNTQQINGVAIGYFAGRETQGTGAIAIGTNAGLTVQGQTAVAIGSNAGTNTQATGAIAIGREAGCNNQGFNAIAIGFQSALFTQGSNAIAIGALAGCNSQGTNAIAIGQNAGCNNQGTSAIAIGTSAGLSGENSNAIAIGSFAGACNQGTNAISMGFTAGQTNQSSGAIAIGVFAGQFTQGLSAIAIGPSAAQSNQGTNAIAIGVAAGVSNQGTNAIAIGQNAGRGTQGTLAIAIGFQAGCNSQGSNSIAIGSNAGFTGQSNNCIAIGALAGQTGQLNNTIIINALGTDVSSINANACYIAPIRAATFTNTLGYDINSREVVYASKTFVIDHPLNKSKYLQHACLEGPEAGVYYRGKGEIINNEYTTVELPKYVSNIASELTVYVTHIYDGKVKSYSAGEIESNTFKVYGENGRFNWMVLGMRQSILVEPSKEDYILRGDGPYTYLTKK
jgi:hypothetical protein